MAAAAFTALKRGLGEVAGGVVVAPEKCDSPSGAITAMVGDHPIPDAAHVVLHVLIAVALVSTAAATWRWFTRFSDNVSVSGA